MAKQQFGGAGIEYKDTDAAAKGGVTMTLRDLARKDVIQLSNGENLGRIDDIEFDEKTAQLTAVVLHGRSRCFGLMGSDEDLVLPWKNVKTIGTDAIMVEPDPEDTVHRRR